MSLHNGGKSRLERRGFLSKEIGDELNPQQKSHLAPYQQPCARPGSPFATRGTRKVQLLLALAPFLSLCSNTDKLLLWKPVSFIAHSSTLVYVRRLEGRVGQYSSALKKHLPRRLAGSWQLSTLPRPHSQFSSRVLRVLAAESAHLYAPNASDSINSSSVTSILRGNWRLTLLGGVGSPAHRLGKSCRC